MTPRARLEAAVTRLLAATGHQRITPLITDPDDGTLPEAHLAATPPLTFAEARRIAEAWGPARAITPSQFTPGAGEIRAHGPHGTLVVFYAGGAR